MNEEHARSWIDTHYGAKAVDALEVFVTLLQAESTRQNLISAASMDAIWVRHILDSAQLLPLAEPVGRWIDIGTGAGFPGIVTGLLSDHETVLVEPRRRRVEFLQAVINRLDLGTRLTVSQTRIERLETQAAIVSARAVATVDAILTSSIQCADRKTQWILPKGRNAVEEVAQARKAWHGTFHVKQSITDPESMIVVAREVSRR